MHSPAESRHDNNPWPRKFTLHANCRNSVLSSELPAKLWSSRNLAIPTNDSRQKRRARGKQIAVQIILMLRQAKVLSGQGNTIDEICGSFGNSDATITGGPSYMAGRRFIWPDGCGIWTKKPTGQALGGGPVFAQQDTEGYSPGIIMRAKRICRQPGPQAAAKRRKSDRTRPHDGPCVSGCARAGAIRCGVMTLCRVGCATAERFASGR